MKTKLKKVAAAITCAVLSVSGMSFPVNAAYVNEKEPNNFDNFAEALQLTLCFYDANKCGDEVGEDGYYSWRGDCHVKDGEIPLQPMNPMPELYGEKENDGSANGEGQQDKDDKDKEDPPKGEGDGDGGLSAAKGLYEGVNMSAEFIEENRKWLDPDGNGTLDLTGGWHDAGDHVKFGLPGSFSASTVGWGYYEFRDDYIEMGLQKHVEDELRWINDFYIKATFLDDKDHVVGYCYQVGEGNNDHNYWCAPELQVDDTVVATASCAVKRPAYFATTEMPAPDQCAGAAASLAINYLNFKDTDPEYAETSLKYARALYDFAVETHKESWTPGSTPSTLVLGYDGGFYHSSYDYDELSWAAVWLYYCAVAEDETQKQAAYDKYIEAIIAVDETTTNAKGAHPYTGYMKRIITDTGNCWQNIWVHCWDTVWGGVFAKLAPITNTARDWYIFRYNCEYWSGCAKTIDSSKWGYEPVHGHKYFGMDDMLWNTPMTYDQIPALPESETSGDFIAKSDYGWAVVSGYGSARYNTAAGLCACVYAKTTGDEVFMPWAKAQMEYILGNNPMGYSYVVGYGNSFASQPHHRSSHCSATQSMDDPVNQVHTLWGALVGGPDLDDFHNDITKDYIYNEVTDDYNAGICGDLAGLYHFYGAKGKELEDKNGINPDFDMSKNAYAGFDQIDTDGNPLPTGLFMSGAWAQKTEAGVQVKVIVHNRTIDPPRFESNLKARYYFNISEQIEAGEDISFIHTETDYDAQAGYSSEQSHATISEPIKYDNDGTYYVEISWQNCDFYGSRIYQFRLVNDMNPETYDTIFDPDNDYSFKDLISFEDENAAEIITERITLYADDKLVWGTPPPNGIEPVPTEPTTTQPAVTTMPVLTTGKTDIKTTVSSAATEKSQTTTAYTTEDDTHVCLLPLWGDVNVDGVVNIADVVALNLNILNSKENELTERGLELADCAYDGKIDTSDSTLLMNYCAEIVKHSDLGNQNQ